MRNGDNPPIRYEWLVHAYAAVNGVLLVGSCIALYALDRRAGRNGIPPNDGLGFRTRRTRSSEQAWYAAQYIGFHISAIAALVVTTLVLVAVALVYIRRAHLAWVVILPVIGWIGLLVGVVVAGHYAERDIPAPNVHQGRSNRAISALDAHWVRPGPTV